MRCKMFGDKLDGSSASVNVHKTSNNCQESNADHSDYMDIFIYKYAGMYSPWMYLIYQCKK